MLYFINLIGTSDALYLPLSGSMKSNLILFFGMPIRLQDLGEVVHPAAAVDEECVGLVAAGIPVVQGESLAV